MRTSRVLEVEKRELKTNSSRPKNQTNKSSICNWVRQDFGLFGFFWIFCAQGPIKAKKAAEAEKSTLRRQNLGKKCFAPPESRKKVL